MNDIPTRPKGMVIRTEEIEPIVESLRSVEKCKFLVFGCGNDTPFWDEVNTGGRTVFLENYGDWIEKVKAQSKDRNFEIYEVKYHTFLSKWKEYLVEEDLSFLEIKLPETVLNTKWDVILVDAPVGRSTKTHNKLYGPPPGRMSSIYMANKLIKDFGTVFIHDITRPAERAFGDRIFGKENLTLQVSYLGKYIKKVKND